MNPVLKPFKVRPVEIQVRENAVVHFGLGKEKLLYNNDLLLISQIIDA